MKLNTSDYWAQPGEPIYTINQGMSQPWCQPEIILCMARIAKSSNKTRLTRFATLSSIPIPTSTFTFSSSTRGRFFEAEADIEVGKGPVEVAEGRLHGLFLMRFGLPDLKVSSWLLTRPPLLLTDQSPIVVKELARLRLNSILKAVKLSKSWAGILLQVRTKSSRVWDKRSHKKSK